MQCWRILRAQSQMLFISCPSNRLSWVHIASKRRSMALLLQEESTPATSSFPWEEGDFVILGNKRGEFREAGQEKEAEQWLESDEVA